MRYTTPLTTAAARRSCVRLALAAACLLPGCTDSHKNRSPISVDAPERAARARAQAAAAAQANREAEAAFYRGRNVSVESPPGGTALADVEREPD